MVRLVQAAGFGAALLAGGVAVAQIDSSGIDFVTVGAPGNAPWPGNGTAGDRAIGRGSVGYEYKIGRYEITTAQWVDFYNAAFDRPVNDRLPNLIPPTYWGAVSTTPNTPGGLRWAVPAGNEMLPVGNISWRMAAMYCNWLCNDKSTDRAAFLNGAYDASTFHYTAPQGFADQPTHTPGARYWIPTWDEWLKAAHFDPNRNGQGQPGWWVYSNGTNTPLIGAPPPSMGGNGQANFGFTTWTNGVNFNSIPLGAYSVTSPWGLYDLAGGATEWTEDVVHSLDGTPVGRRYDGSAWGSAPGDGIADAIFTEAGDELPSISTFDFGLRIATTVPAPSGCFVFGAMLAWTTGRRRRVAWHVAEYSCSVSWQGSGCHAKAHFTHSLIPTRIGLHKPDLLVLH